MKFTHIAFPVLLLFAVLCVFSCSEKATPETSVPVKTLGNKVCPLSGRPVAGTPEQPTSYSDIRGYRLAFADETQKKTFRCPV